MLLAAKWILAISTFLTVAGLTLAVTSFRVSVKVVGGRLLAKLHLTRAEDVALERALVESLTGKESDSNNGAFWISMLMLAVGSILQSFLETPMVMGTGNGWFVFSHFASLAVGCIGIALLLYSAWRVYRIYIAKLVNVFADGNVLLYIGLSLTILGAFGQFVGSLLDLAIEAKWLN